jgi:adenylosuccinate synthase
MLIDVAEKLYTYQDNGDNLLFEGAQGALLDIDHGTRPVVPMAFAPLAFSRA